MELEIENEQNKTLIKKFLPLEFIGVHWSWRFEIRLRFPSDFSIGVHWSPLELEIVDKQKNNLKKKFLPLETIGVHWSWRF